MAIKVRLHSFGQERKVLEPETTISPGRKMKTVVDYPTLSLDTKQLPGIGNMTLDSSMRLIIDVEVTGLREPEKWETRDGRYKSTDKIATFRILGGAVESTEAKQFASMLEAGDAAKSKFNK